MQSVAERTREKRAKRSFGALNIDYKVRLHAVKLWWGRQLGADFINGSLAFTYATLQAHLGKWIL